MSERTYSDYQRFMAKVDTSGGQDACWPWTASRHKFGYGWFSVGGRKAGGPQLAHRWILGYLRDMPLSSDEYALHHCDNPPCCNPVHLYVGDVAQNAQDRVERGRGKNGYSDKEFCVRGHPFDDTNTYVSPDGGRVCRECRRVRARLPDGYKARTHCPQGHPYDEVNTYIYRGSRDCRACHRDRQRARKRQKQEA